jgi:hypothetical protein
LILFACVSIYGVTKIALNAITGILAESVQVENQVDDGDRVLRYLRNASKQINLALPL